MARKHRRHQVPSRQRDHRRHGCWDHLTVVLLGHEGNGVPTDVVEVADGCIEIPMVGIGRSLNVAVAGSLVAYRLAGLA